MDDRWRDAVLLTERRRRRRVARLLKQMDRLEARNAKAVPGDRGRRRATVAVAALVVAVGGLWVASILTEDAVSVASSLPDRPADAMDGPIGAADGAGAQSDAYSFIDTQDGSSDPVTYDPCVPIHVVVDTRTMIDGGMRMLDEALGEIQEATGLAFVVDGVTDDPPAEEVVRDQDGGWSPVTVSWSDPKWSADLKGSVAGYAGSTPLRHDGHWWFVTGSVVLDGPQLADIVDGRRGWQSARSVVMHELGHLVGLDHIDEPGQLMQPEGDDSLTAWGDGDLTGLAALGRGRCISY